MEFVTRNRIKEGKDDNFNLLLSILCKHISLREASKELEGVGIKLAYNSIQARLSKIPKESV